MILQFEQHDENEQILLGHISHWLRSPANGICVAAELLAESTLSQQQRAYLDAILQSSQRLNDSTTMLLEYCSLRSETSAPDPERFDVWDVFSTIIPGSRRPHTPTRLSIAPAVPRVACGGSSSSMLWRPCSAGNCT